MIQRKGGFARYHKVSPCFYIIRPSLFLSEL